MQISKSAITLLAVASSAAAFAPATPAVARTAALQSSLIGSFGLGEIEAEVSGDNGITP